MLPISSSHHEYLTQIDMILSLCFFVLAAQVASSNSIYLPYPEQILVATIGLSNAFRSDRTDSLFCRETKEKAEMSQPRSESITIFRLDTAVLGYFNFFFYHHKGSAEAEK